MSRCGDKSFRTAANLKQPFEFLLIPRGEVAAEERTIDNTVTASGAADNFEARKHIKGVER